MKFLIIVLLTTIIQISNGQRSTTPAWMNVKLMMNYLKAYPSLKNLSSEELGLPDGVDFKHPMYRVMTTSSQPNLTAETTTAPLQSGDFDASTKTARKKNVASTLSNLQSSTSITSTTSHWIGTVATTDESRNVTVSHPATFTSKTFESVAATHDIHAVTESLQPAERLSCLRCVKSNASSDNCTREDCMDGHCILGYIFYSLPSTTQFSVVQMCSRDRIGFFKEKSSSAGVIISDDEFHRDANITIECLNTAEDQLQFNQSNIMYSINHYKSGGYSVRYLCCNNSHCNDADNFHPGVLTELLSIGTEKQASGDGIIEASSADYSLIASSMGQQTTTTSSHYRVESHSAAYVIDATSETFPTKYADSTFSTSQRDEKLSSSQAHAQFEASVHADYGSSSGQSSVQGTTDSAESSDLSRSTTNYYTEYIYESRKVPNMTMGQSLPDDTTTAQYVSGSGSSESGNIAEFISVTPTKQDTFPEYTVSSGSGDGDNFSLHLIPTNTPATRLTVGDVPTTNLMIATNSSKYATGTASRNIFYKDTPTTAHTTGYEQTSHIQISKSHETESWSIKDGIQPTYENSASSDGDTISSVTSATTNQKVVLFTTTANHSDETSSSYSNREKPNYVEFIAISAQYLSRLFLLLNDSINITSVSFLRNLERNLEFAYVRSSRMATAKTKIGVLSRKLLNLNHAINNQFDAAVVILHRTSPFAVLVEFSIRSDQILLLSNEVAQIISQLPLDELSKILGIPVLSPVVPSSVEKIASAWMISALIVIPLMSIALIILCVVTFKKTSTKEIVPSDEQQIDTQPDLLVTHRKSGPHFGCDMEFQTVSIGVGPDPTFLQPLYDEVCPENASSKQDHLVRGLQTVKEESETHSVNSPSLVENDDCYSSIQAVSHEDGSLPNCIADDSSLHMQNAESTVNNVGRIMSDRAPNMTHQYLDSTTDSSLPPITNKSIPLVFQSFPKNWFVSQEEPGSNDGVPEIDANLQRLKTRIRRVKDAERRRNKLRLQQQRSTISAANLLGKYSRNSVSTGVFDVSATPGQLVTTEYESVNSLDSIYKPAPKTFCSEADERNETISARKKKRRKLLMTILKDWENRHLNERTERQDMSPACRMALEAKIRGWGTAAMQDSRTYYPNTIDRRRDNSDYADNNEIQFIRMVRIPARSDDIQP